MPILTKEVPEENRLKRAENIMSSEVKYLRSVATLKRVYECLKSSHHGFPVLNTRGQVIGLIPKNFLVILVTKKTFYSEKNQKYFVIDGKLKKFIKEKMMGD